MIAAITGVKNDYDREGERKVFRLWEELREEFFYAAIEATNTQDADEIYKCLFGDADR